MFIISIQEKTIKQSSGLFSLRSDLLKFKSHQSNITKKLATPNGVTSFFGCGGGTDRLLRLRLAYYRLADRCVATVPVSPLLAKNSPPDCFLNAQTFSGSSPTKLNKKKLSLPKGKLSFFGLSFQKRCTCKF